MLKELLKVLKDIFPSEEQIQRENIKNIATWLEDVIYVQERIVDFGSQAFPREMMAEYGGPIEYNRPLDKDGNKIWNEEPYIFLRHLLDHPEIDYNSYLFNNGGLINQLVRHGIIELDPDRGNRDKYINYDIYGGGTKYRVTPYGKKFKDMLLAEFEFIFSR